MIIRSGLLSSTLQYLCSSRTLCPLFTTPAYKTLPFLQRVDGRPKPRIVKGEFAQPRQFPWMAGLMSFSRQRNPFCGGTLITDRHIVTAAHCLQSKILQFDLTWIHSDLTEIHSIDSKLVNRFHYLVNNFQKVAYSKFIFHRCIC